MWFVGPSPKCMNFPGEAKNDGEGERVGHRVYAPACLFFHFAHGRMQGSRSQLRL